MLQCAASNYRDTRGSEDRGRRLNPNRGRSPLHISAARRNNGWNLWKFLITSIKKPSSNDAGA